MYEELTSRLLSLSEIDAIQQEPGICRITMECIGAIKELAIEAADAIEELLKAAKAMHTWIFLNTGDEQAAYDECGLTDEMNAMLGYSGPFVAELPREET